MQRVFASRWAPLLALIAGAALPLAFEPFGFWWLALIAPAVLFAVGASAPERTATLAGYLFGIGFYGVGVSWIYISIGRYGHSGIVLAVLFTALFVAILALFPLLAVKLARRLAPRVDFAALVIAFPLAWLLLEWVRSWLLTGFPWLLLGYSQTDGPLAPLAPMTGVLGLSMVLSVLAGLLAWVVLLPSPRRALATLVLVSLVVAGVRLVDREWTEVAGEPLSVALIQGNISQDQKWSPEFLQITLDRYRELTEKHWGVDLVVWPEAAVPNWYHRVVDDYLDPLAESGRAHGTELVLGVPYFDVDAGKAYNSIVSLGAERGVYHKRHLVPFGEYLPLRSVFGGALDLLGAPMSDFTPGVVSTPLRAAGHPIGATVCYEVAFGPEVAAVLPEARLLVNVSNDAWFGDSLAPHQHLQMARMRALETGRAMVRATNTGITAVIDHRGRVVARAPQFEVTSLVAEVTPRSGATPYVRWLDYPVLGVLAAGLLGLAIVRRR
jgi:apolipoprotein N-acyltransferase